MDERLDEISAKLDRLLAILDAKEHKKLQDRERIKSKRDDDAAEAAKRRGAIVVDRLTGTFAQEVGVHLPGVPTASTSYAGW